MPTISGLRRRGYTPEAIRRFCERDRRGQVRERRSTSACWRFLVREDLNKRAPRVMAVLRPLKVVIENYPDGQVEEMDVVNNPEDPAAGHAQGAVLAGALHRAGRFPGRPAEEVLPAGAGPRGAAALRLLRHVHEVVKDAHGRDHRAALHLRPGHARRRCAGRPQGEGDDPLGLAHATPSTRRSGCTIACSRSRAPGPVTSTSSTQLNPMSLEVADRMRSSSRRSPRRPAGTRIQFERLGYFCADPDSRPGAPVFNRTVTLKGDRQKT